MPDSPAPANPEFARDGHVEERVPLGDIEVALLRPRNSEALIDDEAFERDEFLPYWAELWPSALVLARMLTRHSLRGARTLELGCGLGLAGMAAALAGGRVLATDWSADAIELLSLNAARNGIVLDAAVCAWEEPAPILAPAPWDLVIASDVLYEPRNVEALLELLPRLVEGHGEIWIADPGRPPAAAFVEAVERDFERRPQHDELSGSVTVHRLRRRRRQPG